jgi:hypothetical protein
MPFFKSARKTEERITAIGEKLLQFTKRKAAKEKDVEEARSNVGKFLGQLALEESPANETQLKTGKKSLERVQESLADICQQIDFLKKEEVRLGMELLEAQLRDVPDMAEQEAESFNKLLTKAMGTVESLAGIYKTMKEHETNFTNLKTQHQTACKKLGKIEPLDLKVIIPFGLQEFNFFLGQLLSYKTKVEGEAAFLKANPSYEANLKIMRAKESEPYKTSMILPRQF